MTWAGKDLRELALSIPETYRGPWSWYGDVDHDYYLATQAGGRQFVMGAARKGMNQAQPTFAHREEGERWHRITRATDIAVKEVPYRGDIVGFDNPFARWIAAASPAAILEIVEENERLREQISKLEDLWDRT